MHFAYLLRYVHRHGWPSIANGSIFASIIALHDHRHHELYYPFIKNAVLDGRIDRQVFDLMYYYLRDNPGENIYASLSKRRYIRFDVTSILSDRMPSNIEEIEKVIAAHCPVDWHWIIEYDKTKDRQYAWAQVYTNAYHRTVRDLQQEIYGYNCHMDRILQRYVETGLWTTWGVLTQNDTSRMYMYISYGPEIKYTDLDILFADTAFATHSILFDNNKAEIKPESYTFLNELTQWLKSKPMVRIEISGHTDNIGSVAANIKLSQVRTNAVKQYLISEGIDSARLIAKGCGASFPIESNATDEGRALNRRVEFKRR